MPPDYDPDYDPGVVPAIHDFGTSNGCGDDYRNGKARFYKPLLPAKRMSESLLRRRCVDGRDKRGHDGIGSEPVAAIGRSTPNALRAIQLGAMISARRSEIAELIHQLEGRS
jgi:hypothetical protein